MEMREILAGLAAGGTLTEASAEATFQEIMAGRAAESQVGALLALIAARPDGPTADEIVGGARALRAHVTPIPLPPVGPGGRPPAVLDTVGTGGAPKLFNISTIAALVISAAAGETPGRLWIVKHGSISRTGRGAADTLGALGYNLAAPVEQLRQSLREIGLCFAFAMQHHPAMRHVAPVRKALGFTTIFNVLGPLTNPAGAGRQLIGVYSPAGALRAAHALARLGTDHSMVFSTRDGLDELTTTSMNDVHEVKDGGVSTRVIDAADLGLPPARQEDVRTNSLDEALAATRQVLAGERGPRRDIVVLNAAAGLMLGGLAADLPAGLVSAEHALDSGAAQRQLQRLIEISRGT